MGKCKTLKRMKRWEALAASNRHWTDFLVWEAGRAATLYKRKRDRKLAWIGFAGAKIQAAIAVVEAAADAQPNKENQ